MFSQTVFENESCSYIGRYAEKDTTVHVRVTVIDIINANNQFDMITELRSNGSKLSTYWKNLSNCVQPTKFKRGTSHQIRFC